MEGTHIDVTTLQRNAYFISKLQDLPSKIASILANSQNQPLGFPLVWGAFCTYVCSISGVQGVKSEHCRWEVCRFSKKVVILHGRDAHRCHHAERNSYLFSKLQDLPSKIVSILAKSQKQPLRFSPLWGAECMVFL